MIHSRKLDELIVHLGARPDVVDLGLTKLWKLIYYIDAQAVRDLGVPARDRSSSSISTGRCRAGVRSICGNWCAAVK